MRRTRAHLLGACVPCGLVEPQRLMLGSYRIPFRYRYSLDHCVRRNPSPWVCPRRTHPSRATPRVMVCVRFHGFRHVENEDSDWPTGQGIGPVQSSEETALQMETKHRSWFLAWTVYLTLCTLLVSPGLVLLTVRRRRLHEAGLLVCRRRPRLEKSELGQVMRRRMSCRTGDFLINAIKTGATVA